MSCGEVAALNRPRIRRSRSACCACTPAFEPVAKNLANPLCLNPRITRISVTQDVTGHKTPNSMSVELDNRAQAVQLPPAIGARGDMGFGRGNFARRQRMSGVRARYLALLAGIWV